MSIYIALGVHRNNNWISIDVVIMFLCIGGRRYFTISAPGSKPNSQLQEINHKNRLSY